ncbi:homoserine O-acetyltransferase [Xanthomonas campestris pv. campestris]|uniref:homoserine O-acetyltransferase MetX n=1 Tax=Xanthomonas campestris TaxID=339 RepID=UPI0025A119F5|nr:homoserine O-acetyltransferase [Xanthomonas campestris]MEB1102334.1 homoserine O-acetyltransferase [Xanthomonas campestris pv. campestris]MDM7583816.1 homoserine O-acetyltransferase [Xanthomonas campestris]MDM7590749.1 homoserine O-acetyltransferase [Xanthomonas campestris]MEA9862924.1 homoserine O-acetyltransferase [Xanthomonas campestris pv. raphani]MEB1621448.1 homoserine O-acetyltransferase [Xanthomonas campestris pv. campestris]
MTEFIPTGTRFHALPSPLPMKRGGVLHQARVAYETWGTLDADHGNAVLIVTGLSPNAHAAANAGNPEPGWWEAMVGPGKPIDTDRWFVVCVNSLGSCKGSTGPASIDPATGAPYRLSFPELSIEDVADAAADVVRALGIAQLACLIGNSMGGMTALALLLRHPGIARSHINISGSAQALPFSIAIRSLQREAIRLDPHWNGGHYDDVQYPESGMRMARKLGVITYRSALEWDGRFGRVRLDSELTAEDPFGLEFQVESYLEGHARRFVRFFDPNCYLYLSRSMDWFDLAEYAPDTRADAAAPESGVLAGLAQIRIARALAIGANTDILFPVQQQEQIAEGLRAGGADAQFLGLDSPQGHDAFLVDFARFGPAVRAFLADC